MSESRNPWPRQAFHFVRTNYDLDKNSPMPLILQPMYSSMFRATIQERTPSFIGRIRCDVRGHGEGMVVGSRRERRHFANVDDKIGQVKPIEVCGLARCRF